MSEQAAARGPSERLFFALWPSATVRAGLGDAARCLQRECSGRATRTENIHLTLVFLGDVAIGRVAELASLVARIAAESFVLAIDRVGYWRHNRVVWAAPGRIPGALLDLVASLERELEAAKFGFDERPYAPHITLLRDARRAPAAAAIPATPWDVERFVLVASRRVDDRTRYEAIGHWPLRDPRMPGGG